MHVLRSLAGALALAGLAAPLAAHPQVPDSASPQASVLRSLEGWREAHGDGWRLRTEPETGAGRLLWGSSARAPYRPTTDAEYEDLARRFFVEAHGMFRLADRDLELERVVELPLSRIGSTDKVAVTFRQEVGGVPVVRGSAAALFGPEGRLLSLDSTGLPGVAALELTPAVGRFAAVAAAGREFERITGRVASQIAEPELVVYPHKVGSTVEARLAWAVELRVPESQTGGLPLGLRLYQAADAGGEILGKDQLVHSQDVEGNVQAFVSPGTLPDMPGNPPALHAVKGIHVRSSAGDTLTDEDGDFTIPNVGGDSITVTFEFDGPLCKVVNKAGSDYAVDAILTPGMVNPVLMNSAPSEYTTAQANIYESVIEFNDWVHEIMPDDDTMDIRVKAKANVNSICNAYYNGLSINHFRAGGPCNNTGYSTVVAHEEGHWANDRYASSNGADGFGEGNADVFSMYIYDTAIVGEFFGTGGGYIRTGDNTRQFCGDNNAGCYGEVHVDGEVLMGALWKARENLNATLGDEAGDLVADTLFLSWMNAYDDRRIQTIIEEHWLILDDDDGNFYNGTPNFQEINDGFEAQGFPGVELDVISVSHTELGSTLDQDGPYTVDITAEAVDGNSVASAALVYQVGGINPVTVPMADLGGGSFSAEIPGVAAPASIQYWIELEDDLGGTDVAPRGGDRWDFVVGTESPIWATAMEPASPFAEGALLGSSDWDNGFPAGGSGSDLGGWADPRDTYYGAYIWGTDLGGGGAYANDAHTWLECPPVDCSGRSGVHLRFRRWLTVDSSANDVARILVNGVELWRNPADAPLLDETWMEVELDISSEADGDPNVVVRFELESDSSVVAGGWNVDDLQLVSIVEPGNLYLSGPEVVIGGATAGFRVTGLPATGQAYLLSSSGNAGSIIRNHPFDISRPFVIEEGPVSPEPDGSYLFHVYFPYGTPPGVRFYEVGARGNGGPLLDSNAVMVEIH